MEKHKTIVEMDELTYDTLKILAKKKGIATRTYISEVLTDYVNNTEGTDKIKKVLSEMSKIEA